MGRSMTLTYAIPGVVLLVSMLEPTIAVNNCSAGRFGSTCIFSCNCERSLACGEDGECPNNEPCKSPYFGPGCQYVDLMITNILWRFPPYLWDRNHSTCNPDATARSLDLRLQLNPNFPWIQIHVSNNLTLFHRNFTVTLNMNPGTRSSRFRTGDTSMIVIFDLDANKPSKILIEGPVVQHICTINVSGGRNVARNQRVSQSSNYSRDPLDKVRAENSVDGNNSPDYASGTCSRTEFESPPNIPHWIITFDRTYAVHSMNIYNANVNMSWLSGFSVAKYNEQGRVIFNHLDRTGIPLLMYSFVFYDNKPFTKMKIAANSSSNSSHVLLMCEVEMLGDLLCPSQTWGLECQHQCQCGSGVRCSNLTGSCEYTPVFHCPLGTHGEHCEKSCPENCQYSVCDARSGACLQCIPGYQGGFCDEVCVLGRFGPNCSRQCSENCIEPCNHTNGFCECLDKFAGDLCTECEHGLVGEHCDLTCPRICPVSCNSTTGECASCVGQRTGPMCEDCPPRYYGALCDIRCSLYCWNRSCNPVDGICYQCVEGYKGEYCNLEEESVLPSIWLLPLIVPYLVLMMCCVFVGGGSVDSDEG